MATIKVRRTIFEVIDILSSDDEDNDAKKHLQNKAAQEGISNLKQESIHKYFQPQALNTPVKCVPDTCSNRNLNSPSHEKDTDMPKNGTVSALKKCEVYSSDSTSSSIEGVVPVAHFSGNPVLLNHHTGTSKHHKGKQPMVNGRSPITTENAIHSRDARVGTSHSKKTTIHVYPSHSRDTTEPASHSRDGTESGNQFTESTEKILEYFISSLTPLMKGEKEKKIVCRIHYCASRCQPSFLDSDSFKELVREKVACALQNRDRLFLCIRDVYDTMKAYKKPKAPSAAGSEAVTIEYSGALSDHQDNSVPCDTDKQNATEAHVARLEKLLAKFDQRIRKLQQKELSLDDLEKEDSNYILEDRYKKRFVKVWNKLCELKGRSCSTGRHLEKKIHFEGTRYPEINRRVERFINERKRNSRNPGFFPDYKDILTIVESVNKSGGLNLTTCEQNEIACEAFEDVGKALKKRRQRDEKELFGSFLTDTVEDDPAENDPVLKEQLEKNDRVASTIEEVIKKFAEKERALKLVPEEVLDEEADSSPRREEDDDEEIENQSLMETDALKMEMEDEASEVAHSEVTSQSSGDEDLLQCISFSQRQNRDDASSTSSKASTSKMTRAISLPAKRIRLEANYTNCASIDSDEDVIVLD